jgi:hypothetical protein
MSNYKEKYLKYKSKYLDLKKQTGGNLCDFENWIKLDTNPGQLNCGIFLHKTNPKLIMKCGESESDKSMWVNEINSKAHLFPIIYSFCKDDKNESYSKRND